MQEHDPLFSLTRGDVQTAAQGILGRDLNAAELDGVMDTFRRTFNWPFFLERFIRVGQWQGKVGPDAGSSPYIPQDDDVLQMNIGDLDLFSEEREDGNAEFEAYYLISGKLRVVAATPDAAREQGFVTLKPLVGTLAHQDGTLQVSILAQSHEAKAKRDATPVGAPAQEQAEVSPQEFFEITHVSRKDLEAIGFDTREITDEQMQVLANKMAEYYVGQHFWVSLQLLAEIMGLPRWSIADKQHKPEDTFEPLPPSASGVPVSRDHSPQTVYLVDYHLSSSMPVQASAEAEASEQAFATLHGLIGQAGLLGVPVRVAHQVRLDYGEIRIDGVEAAPPGQEMIETPPPDLFEITGVSRDDLQGCGFDVRQVSDAQMEQLASKMADQYRDELFWPSLTFIAETLGFPKQF